MVRSTRVPISRACIPTSRSPRLCASCECLLSYGGICASGLILLFIKAVKFCVFLGLASGRGGDLVSGCVVSWLSSWLAWMGRTEGPKPGRGLEPMRLMEECRSRFLFVPLWIDGFFFRRRPDSSPRFLSRVPRVRVSHGEMRVTGTLAASCGYGLAFLPFPLLSVAIFFLLFFCNILR